MKLVWLFLLSFINIAMADSAPIELKRAATAVIDQKTYPAKLVFMCTMDQKPNAQGTLTLNMELPKVVEDYFPMNDIEGPGAKKVVKAILNAQSKIQKNSLQIKMPTSVWYGESNQINFGVMELHSAHKDFYSFVNYLAIGANNFEITLENPQKNKSNLLIKMDVTANHDAIKKLLQDCGL